MSLICEACSHENAESALFCKACGRPIAESDAADSLIGHKILDTYLLERLLGKGGMSVVYLARHELTDQEVAVKILPPELAGQKELKTRFIEEARALARLEHPNIVVLHNLVEQERHLYLVMQYAEGETFDSVIAREGRVELGEAAEIGIEVLRALEYAHDQGVIHRDIKPSNIIIRGDGSVKVMDFGLAKFMGSTKLTQTGLTMGTVRYMSPEQVRGKQVDHRTDIYSLGVTIYEAVTGHTPFDGETHFEIMQQHLSAKPPPMGLSVQVPVELESALTRAMAKKVAERFQSAREFRHALQRVPVKSSRRRALSAPLPPAVTAEAERLARQPTALPRRARIRILPILVAVTLLVLSGGAVFWATLDESPGAFSSSDSGPGTSPPPVREMPWPKPHEVAAALSWRVDKTFGPPIRLRVMSMQPIDAERIRDMYQKAREAYRRFLRQEGIDLDFTVGPLNLAFVDQAVLNDRKHWPDAKTNVDYPTRYHALAATLYVHNTEGTWETDFEYGLALHFCARIAKLSNQRCHDLAEGFELFFRETL